MNEHFERENRSPGGSGSISARDSSRARMTRVQPSSRASATPAALVIDICVDAWISRSGVIARISRASPRSCTITASTPADVSTRTVAFELGHLAGKDQRVERHIAANAAPVQERHHLGQIGAIEVIGANAGVVTLKTEVNGIGAVFHGGRQALSITGRRQELGLGRTRGRIRCRHSTEWPAGHSSIDDRF